MTDKKDCGALWKRTKGEKEYMTGNITIDGAVHEIVVFANGFKKAPNQPDFRIYPSTPVRDDKIEYPVGDINPDDIPF